MNERCYPLSRTQRKQKTQKARRKKENHREGTGPDKVTLLPREFWHGNHLKLCYLMRPVISNTFSQVFDSMHREAINTNAGHNAGAVT